MAESANKLEGCPPTLPRALLGTRARFEAKIYTVFLSPALRLVGEKLALTGADLPSPGSVLGLGEYPEDLVVWEPTNERAVEPKALLVVELIGEVSGQEFDVFRIFGVSVKFFFKNVNVR